MGEPVFGVFIEYGSIAEAEMKAGALSKLFPEQQVLVVARASGYSARSVLLKTSIYKLPLGQYGPQGKIARVVARWFKLNSQDSRRHSADFLLEDLLEVPASFFVERKIPQRDMRLLRSYLRERDLELKE